MRKIYIPAYIIEWKDVKIALVFLGTVIMWILGAIWWLVKFVGKGFKAFFLSIKALFTATKEYDYDDDDTIEEEPVEKGKFDMFDQEL